MSRRGKRFFAVGFIGGLLICLALNLLAAHLRSDCGLPAVLGLAHCADDIRRAGFPFLFWEEGGFAYRVLFSWPALAADVAVAFGVSAIAGFAVQRLSHRGER